MSKGKTVEVDISYYPRNGEVKKDDKGYYYDSSSGGKVLVTDAWYPDPDGTYMKLTHTPENAKIQNIYHSGNPLSGITDLGTHKSVSVYYWSLDETFENPLLIQLGDEYYIWSKSGTWTNDPGASNNLRGSLNKQNCERNKAHIVKISERVRSGGSTTYECPSGCGTRINLNNFSGSGLTFCTHSISSGSYYAPSFSVSGFINGNSWQAGLPSIRDSSSITVYFESKNNIPIVIDYQKGGEHWFRRNTKDNKTWTAVPKDQASGDKTEKLLNQNPYYLQITLDLSNPSGTYSDNGVSITVRNTPIGDDYYISRHSLCGGLFELKGVTHNDAPLTDIKSGEKLESVSAYYYGTDLKVDRLLRVELRSHNGDVHGHFYKSPKDNESMVLSKSSESSNTGILAGTSVGTGLGGAGLGALAVWKGPALIAKLIARL
ncbi:hypothetical protein BEWA_035680 [Theileria equi strain WA]|uniref:Uncharacterized protein n=1 Tax=Theileria equi strain WA TaxID=1537102 RepID=L1LDK6_THEEQ|nr:hypothetical protein BEWA_035680 [Theileria equi strain WA]EKX73532.1 hypothetical protein BEWA_035680 [Theileria equi strain WA]|eukprot:XP_004832984.1 hypothetical protein BEWA_035680 [Theileria equi strain WA]